MARRARGPRPEPAADGGAIAPLSRLPMFRGTPRERLAALARQAFVMQAPAGSAIVRRGERVPGLVVVAEGLAKARPERRIRAGAALRRPRGNLRRGGARARRAAADRCRRRDRHVARRSAHGAASCAVRSRPALRARAARHALPAAAGHGRRLRVRHAARRRRAACRLPRLARRADGMPAGAEGGDRLAPGHDQGNAVAPAAHVHGPGADRGREARDQDSDRARLSAAARSSASSRG